MCSLFDRSIETIFRDYLTTKSKLDVLQLAPIFQYLQINLIEVLKFRTNKVTASFMSFLPALCCRGF